MLIPPAPAGVAANNSSPSELFNEMLLLCTLMFTLWQYGNCAPVTALVSQDPGAALVADPWTYDPGNSPWPMLIPPDSVATLPYTRLLAICMSWFQPCRKRPPPPCELFVMPNPSMLDGLQ